GEGLHTPSCFGAAGGEAGAVGEMELAFADGGTEQPPKYAVRHYQPLTMRAASPGGGGWGDPLDRPADKVLKDVKADLVSPEKAKSDYGVVIDDDLAIDTGATEALRSAMRTERGEPAPFDFGVIPGITG
ncbi:MAG: hypothetical protein ABGW90_02570, partial [Martelella sp.]